MKKLLFGALLLVVIGAALWFTTGSPERDSCVKLGELCGGESADLGKLDQCVDGMESVSEDLSDKKMEKLNACIEKAETCPEAMGCMAGSGFSKVSDVAGDFLDGFTKSLKDDDDDE